MDIAHAYLKSSVSPRGIGVLKHMFTVFTSVAIKTCWNILLFLVVQSLIRVRLFATPWTVLTSSSVHGISQGKNIGVGCHFLLPEIFTLWARPIPSSQEHSYVNAQQTYTDNTHTLCVEKFSPLIPTY